MLLDNDLNRNRREDLTSSPQHQEIAHASGAYSYLKSIHLTPRHGIIASYVRVLSAMSVFDIGCGTADLCNFLHSDVFYRGIDISNTAINYAIAQHAGRDNCEFICSSVYKHAETIGRFDCSVWAGVGKGITRSAKAPHNWVEIIDYMHMTTSPKGHIIIEGVQEYHSEIKRLTIGLDIITESIFSCITSDDHSNRFIIVYENFKD